MEIRARYVLIGLFVLAVLVGGFSFVFWLQNSGGIGERAIYRVSFNGSVSGLSAGSDVLFNGMDVGEVTSLSLVIDSPGDVMATIAVHPNTPIRADTHVGLVFAGLTGTAAVALTGGASTAPALTSADGQPPLLVADPAAMRDMTQAARDVLGRLDTLVAENSATLKDTIANIGSFSAALARNSDRVDGILQGLERLTGGKTEAPPTIYDLTAPSVLPAIEPLPSAQLSVPQPTAVITLDTQRIMLQTADGEAPAFPQVRWADNIPLLVQARIVQTFENANFLKVGTDAGDLEADYKLAIDVRKFRITSAPGPAAAEAEFSVKLLDGDGKVVDAKVFAASAPVSAIDNASIAEKGIDAAFGTAATDIVVWTLNAMNAQDAADVPAEAPADPAPADAPPADAAPTDAPVPDAAPAGAAPAEAAPKP